jgi:hypothetical protein
MKIFIWGGADQLDSHLIRPPCKKDKLSRVVIFDDPGPHSHFDGQMAFPLHIAEEMILTLAPTRSEDVKQSTIRLQTQHRQSRKAGETKC